MRIHGESPCGTQSRFNVDDVSTPEGDYVDSDALSAAVVVAIKDCAVPHIDRRKLVQAFGMTQGGLIAARVSELVHEAVAMPIEWGNKTLAEGVNDILRRFHEKHPELSQEALHEIGRCVGWNLR